MKVKEIADLLKQRGQLFLTGAGGVGKTYSVNRIASRFSNVIRLGSTNMSAQAIGGDTVHAFFGLGLANNEIELEARDNDYIDWFTANVKNDRGLAQRTLLKKIRQPLERCELIIIDEVSMISASVLDLIYLRLEQCNLIHIPILFVGDLYQLPPVSKEYEAKLIFNSKHWNPAIIELTEIKRTHNKQFAEIQKHIRLGLYTREAHEVLESIQSNTYAPDYNPIILTPTNAQAVSINQKRLAELDTPTIISEGRVESNIKDPARIQKILEDNFIVDRVMEFKVGASVIFTQTSKEQGYYNGMQATITDIIDHNPSTLTLEVTDKRGTKYAVSFVEYSRKRVQSNPQTGALEYVKEVALWQLPIKPAYAITIHKSQGMSLAEVQIECSRMFEAGQFYVALSRATDPTKVKLINFDRKYVRIHNEAIKAYFSTAEVKQITAIEDDDNEYVLDKQELAELRLRWGLGALR